MKLKACANRRCGGAKIGLLLVLLLGLGVGIYFLAEMGPYGEERLPEWISQGKPIVQAIESYRSDNEKWPPDLSTLVPDYLNSPPTPSLLTGCNGITYQVVLDRDSMFIHRIGPSEFLGGPSPEMEEEVLKDGTFSLRFHIHKRELVAYNSNGDTSEDWGTRRVLDGWIYTKD